MPFAGPASCARAKAPWTCRPGAALPLGTRYAATVLQAELPVIPVLWYQHSATSSQRLRNVSLDPMEMSYRLSQAQGAR